jgi:hypothetical protein
MYVFVLKVLLPAIMRRDIQTSTKSFICNRLERIAKVLLLNASFIDNIGLLNGKMGIAIFFYQYGRYTNNKVYTDYAGELIDEIYEEVNTNTSVDFTNGLTGIGWGIEYLVENKYIDADTDEALAEIDNVVYRSILDSPLLLDNGSDLFGYGLYSIARSHGHEHDDDNLTTLIKKEHLIYLTDECERLLVHKRYLEFNILKLSLVTVNSLLWFLLEMERLNLFPSKVCKILKYLPDYLSYNHDKVNSYARISVLHELSEKAAGQLVDVDLKTRYRLLSDLTKNEKMENISDNKSVLKNLQSIHLQKLIFKPYINNVTFDSNLYERAFEIINSDELWDRTLNGLNNSNMGLTGLAGTGLLLLDTMDLAVHPDLSRRFGRDLCSASTEPKNCKTSN